MIHVDNCRLLAILSSAESLVSYPVVGIVKPLVFSARFWSSAPYSVDINPNPLCGYLHSIFDVDIPPCLG
jgi:hypothetical protein